MTLLISHIPKTAGTSLRTMVNMLCSDAVWSYSRELSLGNPSFEFIQNFKNNVAPSVLMGHFSYGVHRFLNVQPIYATVLRNPIDRIVSLFNHQKSLPDSDFIEHFRKSLTLHEFVSQGVTEMTNNHACRMIAGIAPDAGLVINERWLLDLAIHNLCRHYHLVGVIEKIDVFNSLLTNYLGLKKIDFPIENVAASMAVKLDEITLNTIINNNKLDIELYEYVLHERHLCNIGGGNFANR